MDEWKSTMENMVSFWQNKKVFLTGHTGFKGSWLAAWLKYLGAHVVGYALSPPTERNLFTEAKINNDVVDIRGDITHYDAVLQAIKTHQPEIIFHLAAQPLVKESYLQPLLTYATNVMGTAHVLEAARQISTVRAIVNITTDKCYDNKEWHWSYRENEPLGGHDPYSSSKACAELVTSAYQKSFFQTSTQVIGLASARAGNVIGGGDWANHRIIPDIIRAFEQQSTLELRYPQAIRPWQHVLEPLAGYLMLAQKLYEAPQKYSQAWNFGPQEQDAKSVLWITQKTIHFLDQGLSYRINDQGHAHEATYLKLDCAKAKTYLHWQPLLGIEEALALTVEWYKARFAKHDMKEKTLAQIAFYMDLLPSNKGDRL